MRFFLNAATQNNIPTQRNLCRACITPCPSLGNDETCVNVLRMVHAVLEGGGALVSVTSKNFPQNNCNNYMRFSSKQASLPF